MILPLADLSSVLRFHAVRVLFYQFLPLGGFLSFKKYHTVGTQVLLKGPTVASEQRLYIMVVACKVLGW